MTRQRNWDHQAISTSTEASTTNRSRQGTGARSVLATFSLILGCAVFWLPGSALAAPALHEITWAHNAAAEVQNFVVFVSAVQGDQANSRQISVGKPASQSDSGSLQTLSAIVSVELDEYVAVAALALDGSLSELSRWSGMPPSRPGQPFLIP